MFSRIVRLTFVSLLLVWGTASVARDTDINNISGLNTTLTGFVQRSAHPGAVHKLYVALSFASKEKVDAFSESAKARGLDVQAPHAWPNNVWAVQINVDTMATAEAVAELKRTIAELLVEHEGRYVSTLFKQPAGIPR